MGKYRLSAPDMVLYTSSNDWLHTYYITKHLIDKVKILSVFTIITTWISPVVFYNMICPSEELILNINDSKVRHLKPTSHITVCADM